MVVVEKKMEHEALKRNEYGCTVRVESSAGVWGGEGGVQGGGGGVTYLHGGCGKG